MYDAATLLSIYSVVNGTLCEGDLTPAHFHWVVVIARAAAARTAAPRSWRGRGLGDGSAGVAAAAGTSKAMPKLLEC